MSRVFLFPGQGSQRPGMASSFSLLPGLLQEITERTGVELRAEPTFDQIGDTRELQLWLLASSVAGARAMRAREYFPDAVLGHSVGDYAALVTAGVLEFGDAAWLVARRAGAMKAAGANRPGSMAAVLGLPAAVVEGICSSCSDAASGVWVANWNSPSQVVISGDDLAVQQAAVCCRAAGAERVLPLRVPLAGHCPHMEPAAREMMSSLSAIEFRTPICSVYSGYDVGPHDDVERISESLGAGMTTRVAFAAAVSRAFDDGHRQFVEIGPGRVLARLVSEILGGKAEVFSVTQERDVTDFEASRLEPVGLASGQ